MLTWTPQISTQLTSVGCAGPSARRPPTLKMTRLLRSAAKILFVHEIRSVLVAQVETCILEKADILTPDIANTEQLTPTQPMNK